MKNTVMSIVVIATLAIGGFIGTGTAAAEHPTDNHGGTTYGPYCGCNHWEH